MTKLNKRLFTSWTAVFFYKYMVFYLTRTTTVVIILPGSYHSSCLNCLLQNQSDRMTYISNYTIDRIWLTTVSATTCLLWWMKQWKEDTHMKKNGFRDSEKKASKSSKEWEHFLVTLSNEIHTSWILICTCHIN